MDEPSTRPSGLKPTPRTSRNSFTDRSEVKIEPALPGCSSASRLIASCGTPAAPRSVVCWLVIEPSYLLCSVAGALSPVLADVDARGLTALRVKGHDGERRLPRPFGMTALKAHD